MDNHRTVILSLYPSFNTQSHRWYCLFPPTFATCIWAYCGLFKCMPHKNPSPQGRGIPRRMLGSTKLRMTRRVKNHETSCFSASSAAPNALACRKRTLTERCFPPLMMMISIIAMLNISLNLLSPNRLFSHLLCNLKILALVIQ